METRTESKALLIGGAVWTATGLLGLSSTKGSGRFYTAEVCFIGAHLLVLPGLIALERSQAASQGWARNGLRIAVGGRVLFLVAEIAAIVTANDELFVFPAAAMSTAIGMAVGGIGIARAGRWSSWRRWAPLAMGAYPFVAMFPLLATTGRRPDVPVALWGLVQSAVGLALMIEEPNPSEARPATVSLNQ